MDEQGRGWPGDSRGGGERGCPGLWPSKWEPCGGTVLRPLLLSPTGPLPLRTPVLGDPASGCAPGLGGISTHISRRPQNMWNVPPRPCPGGWGHRAELLLTLKNPALKVTCGLRI